MTFVLPSLQHNISVTNTKFINKCELGKGMMLEEKEKQNHI